MTPAIEHYRPDADKFLGSLTPTRASFQPHTCLAFASRINSDVSAKERPSVRDRYPTLIRSWSLVYKGSVQPGTDVSFLGIDAVSFHDYWVSCLSIGSSI